MSKSATVLPLLDCGVPSLQDTYSSWELAFKPEFPNDRVCSSSRNQGTSQQLRELLYICAACEAPRRKGAWLKHVS